MKTETIPNPYSLADKRTSTAGFAKAVLLYGGIAGVLDIIAAHLHIWGASGKFPVSVFKGIAGGALGRQRSFEGGFEMVLLGVFFHFFISYAFTLFYFLVYSRVELLRKSVWLTGTIFGLFTFVMMTYVVLPLSALPWRAPNYANMHTYIGWAIIIGVFGLPIAYGASRYYKRSHVS